VEVNVERLLGARVRDVNGEVVGRIEEIQVERREKDCLVQAFLVGASAVVDRLSAWTLVRPIRKVLRSRKVLSVYRIAWNEMDLSDPKQPRFLREKRDLRRSD
jgi:sporulation protein YlmC with PRC-barrel domain